MKCELCGAKYEGSVGRGIQHPANGCPLAGMLFLQPDAIQGVNAAIKQARADPRIERLVEALKDILFSPTRALVSGEARLVVSDETKARAALAEYLDNAPGKGEE